MYKRTYRLPEKLDHALRSLIAEFGLLDAKKIADAVRRLSDHYIANPETPTPWHEPWAKLASLAYFFPLNYARNRAVFDEGQRLGFFSGLDEIIDFGSGTGSAILAFDPSLFHQRRALDISQAALDLSGGLAELAGIARPESIVVSENSSFPPKNLREETHFSSTLFTASYALTELPEMPQWWTRHQAIAIIEPSTKAAARKLMTLRTELLSAGFHIWAPCTHAESCPLLMHSEKDWCHDRIHWQAPAWWLEIEKHLPMKNRTLTFSYLLARKSAPPASLQRLARLVGDPLIEKGKSRQALCRGSEREFLAWFPQRLKKGAAIELERGNLVRLSGQLEKKSSEVRIDESSYDELPPTEVI